MFHKKEIGFEMFCTMFDKSLIDQNYPDLFPWISAKETLIPKFNVGFSCKIFLLLDKY
jgi:hypothetical protein